jgi:hypothetical protein
MTLLGLRSTDATLLVERLAPVLTEVGVQVVKHREGKLGTRIIHIRRAEVPE